MISLGIDQDAQENFYHPERQDPRRTGAGGVPVRRAEDYQALFTASRRGNYPLLRTYSGTDDFIRLAEMYVETIHNAWCAIPLFWFNQMDGRGPWDLEGSIREHQQVMAWYGARGVPVELNEPHHWGMRDAPDVVFVVSAYLAAYNARSLWRAGLYCPTDVQQPAGPLRRDGSGEDAGGAGTDRAAGGAQFPHLAADAHRAVELPAGPHGRARHLAASVYLQMALHPHIIHIVGHTEAHHAATAGGCDRGLRAGPAGD